MMKKEPESWDAAWNDLDRAFSISCKPTAKRVPKGYVFDEDKSVRWNAEQVESHNVEIQKEVSEKQKARSLAINKATDAIIALIVDEFYGEINSKQAEVIWNIAYEGLYLSLENCEDGAVVVACDNSTGFAYIEEFDSVKDAIKWLRREEWTIRFLTQ